MYPFMTTMKYIIVSFELHRGTSGAVKAGLSCGVYVCAELRFFGMVGIVVFEDQM